MIYSLEDLSLREIRAIRKSLDYIPITGIDAAFIAILQNKIQQQIQQIEDFLRQEEEEKQNSLAEAIQNDTQSVSPPPSKKK
jgi:cell division protein ZapA (FtsZ GTPase activity inhibitor)